MTAATFCVPCLVTLRAAGRQKYCFSDAIGHRVWHERTVRRRAPSATCIMVLTGVVVWVSGRPDYHKHKRKRPIESPPAAALETLRRHGMYSSQEQDDIMHQALLGIDSSNTDLLISSHARETLCSFSTMHYGQSPNIRFATLTSVAGRMQQ
jgi:hypothetical protein